MRPVLWALAATAASAQASACQPALLAALPIETYRSVPVVAVAINGQPARFILDTGAQWTAITPAAAMRLGLAPDRSRKSESHGLGADGTEAWNYDASTRSVAIGAMALGAMPLHVASILGGTGDVDGVIGADILSRHDLELDMPSRMARIYDSSGCAGDFVPWAGTHDWVEDGWAPSNQGQLNVPVTLGDVPIEAAIDTGSAQSMVEAGAAASAQGAEPQGAPSGGSATDGTGRSIPTTTVVFAHASVGQEGFSDLAVEACDCDIPGAQMQVGEDYLSVRVVWLSFPTGQVFIRRPAAR